MIVKEIYKSFDTLIPTFDFESNGRDTLEWLRDMWQWNRDRHARTLLDKFSRKFSTWKKKKEDELRLAQDTKLIINFLDKLAREREVSP